MISNLLIVTSVMLGQTDAAPAVDVKAEVRKLVRQLDSQEVALREAAEKALIELGPDVLTYIPQIRRNTPAEVAVRLRRVMKTLETSLVEATTRETLVTLKGEMTAAAALAELEKQTGNRVIGLSGDGADVNVDFDKTRYWEALDQILDQANMALNVYGGEMHALTIMQRGEGQGDRHGAANYEGLFRFEATRVEAARDLRNDTANTMRVRLEISWEPRLTPISIAQPLADVEAEDQNSNEVTVAGEGARGNQGRPDISSMEIDIPFQLPDRESKKIASLKGKIVAVLPGRLETFEFEDLSDADNDVQQKAGVSVTLEQVRQNGDVHEFRVLVRFDDSGNAFETHRSFINNNQAYLVDKNNERVDAATYEVKSQAEDEIGIGYLFALEDDLDTYRFVYKTPAMIVRLPVEYELEDIPLP